MGESVMLKPSLKLTLLFCMEDTMDIILDMLDTMDIPILMDILDIMESVMLRPRLKLTLLPLWWILWTPPRICWTLWICWISLCLLGISTNFPQLKPATTRRPSDNLCFSFLDQKLSVLVFMTSRN